jgi:hypothetical protein
MMRKNKRPEHVAKEREDIAARVAQFRATQERFAREREEYAESVLQRSWMKTWSRDR